MKTAARHDLFQQLQLALAHQQDGNIPLALAYWENLLKLLPREIQIHNEILDEFLRLSEHEALPPKVRTQAQRSFTRLYHSYHLALNDDEKRVAQTLYRALCQQCGGNPLLAVQYWPSLQEHIPEDALIVTLVMQDFRRQADLYLESRQTEQSIRLYKSLLRVFPNFLEGYLNLSIIIYRNGLTEHALPIIQRIPQQFRHEFIVIRYTDLYQTISELSKFFAQVPYSAIEEIINDLRMENTFYPLLNGTYFEEFVNDIILREKRFFERRRKAQEEKALAQTYKRLASEGIALGERVSMAKQADSESLYDFLYDNHIRIAEVLLDNPNITADDVLVMAQVSHISDILRDISQHRKWGVLRSIQMAILLNPQTLPNDALPLLQRLSFKDLAALSHKKTIAAEIRIQAKQRIQEIFHSLSFQEKIALLDATSGEVFKLLDTVRFNLPSFLINTIGTFQDRSDILSNICRWKLTPPEILTFIANTTPFRSSMPMKFALLSNPRTPQRVTDVLLRSISERDLRCFLSNDYLPKHVKDSIATMFPHLFS
ncbi:hypothetical protein CSB45_03245 [candidate division KSB3 bacterium]|uniref:Uncharacterized protein n=1 Tax=candidate division KSB3 bacterium TaxID=2044937 RepID=A0A2G6E912_9BACT|nr:MAG: hypothetical protein CSB45_03245 [candidate division KSB3 bacterium]